MLTPPPPSGTWYLRHMSQAHTPSKVTFSQCLSRARCSFLWAGSIHDATMRLLQAVWYIFPAHSRVASFAKTLVARSARACTSAHASMTVAQGGRADLECWGTCLKLKPRKGADKVRLQSSG